jgi:hypothetical protein
MSNILMIPASGSIIFDSQSANSSVISPLSAAPRLSYDNGGGLNITSYTTGTTTLDRFSVDGSAGRLFSISDSLTGTIFSVNDAAGLPIIQVDSDTTDIVNIGPYGTSTFVTSGSSVGIGTAAPISKLHIVDRTLAATGGLSGSILNLEQTWNTTGAPTAIKLNVSDTASNGASNLMDLQVSGVSKFRISKAGSVVTTELRVTNGELKFLSDVNNRFYADGAGLKYRGGALELQGNNGSPPGILSFYTSYLQGPNLVGEANGVIAQRNGINPQAFRLYNTYTSSTNFERLNLRWDTNVIKIGTEKGSAGGTARDLVFETDATGRMTIGATGDITFSNPTQVRTALGFVQLTPSAYADLVASGIANPDTIYIVQE